MKKKLNETGIVNELKGSSVFFPSSPVQSPIERTHPQRERREEKVKPVNQSTSQSTSQPVEQSTVQSIRLPIDMTIILGRPKAFYITQQQDKDLDVAVDKLAEKVKGKVNQKIDRSTILRLLLELNNITANEAIDKLARQLINRLVSQLTG